MKDKDIRNVHIVLKDGTNLDCVIYKNGEKGELPISDYIQLNDLLHSKTFVHFQTRYINGKFHTDNIENYTVTFPVNLFWLKEERY